MKTVWAFEPENQKNAPIKGMAKLVGQLCQSERDLGVGYVVTGNESYLNTAYDVPYEERFTTYPKKLILQNLKKSGVGINPSRVHVIQHRTLSTTAAVDKLLNFAKSEKAKLLALFTHNKTGLGRFVMGSFAETAIHRSKIDLLLAGPRTKYPSRVRSVLYSSDFVPSSKRDLRRVLKICKQLGARLTVFHAAQITYRWAFDETNTEVQAYRQKTKQMSDWIESECKKAGVSCAVVVATDFQSIPDLALEAARKAKADLIVVSAKVGPLGALMGGSVTRNIVRDAIHPVLVLKS